MRTAKSADVVYVDPSALRSLYVHDARSRAIARWRTRHAAALPVTEHGHAELLNAIALAAFRGELTTSDLTAAVEDFESDLEAGRLVRTDLPWRRTFARAASLSLAHTPALGTRTLDVLHVASALELRCRTLVTYDERQARLARAAGLRVRSP